MPEDVAEQLLLPHPRVRVASYVPNGTGAFGGGSSGGALAAAVPHGLTIDDVVIRGGDVFVPLSNSVQTALFLDTGNLWTSPRSVDPLKLRYATGTGLRIGTPVGPLAFDYGFNVDRVLDEAFPKRKNQRTWESLGAFHFSIGVL